MTTTAISDMVRSLLPVHRVNGDDRARRQHPPNSNLLRSATPTVRRIQQVRRSVRWCDGRRSLTPAPATAPRLATGTVAVTRAQSVRAEQGESR